MACVCVCLAAAFERLFLRPVAGRYLLGLRDRSVLGLILLGLADHDRELLLVALHLQVRLHLLQRQVLAVADARRDELVKGEEELEGVLADGLLVDFTRAVLGDDL